jgi:hypothetical protein
VFVGLFRKSLVALHIDVGSSTSPYHQLGLEAFDVVFEIEDHPNHYKNLKNIANKCANSFN